MNTKLQLVLTPTQQSQLTTLMRESPSYRVRQRCQALLWSHQGYDRQTIAALFTVKPDTVSAWFTRWQVNHLAGLGDQARSGRPTKLTQPEKKA